MEQIRQLRPDSGLGFQVKALKTLYGVPSSLGRGGNRGRLGRERVLLEGHTLTCHDGPLRKLRFIDSCITQLGAQGPSRTCNESKDEEEGATVGGWDAKGSCSKGIL